MIHAKKVKSFVISRKTINQKITVLNKLNIFYALCLRLVWACVLGHVLCYKIDAYSNLFVPFILKVISSPYAIQFQHPNMCQSILLELFYSYDVV